MQQDLSGVDRFSAAHSEYAKFIRWKARQQFSKIPGMGVDDLEGELLEVLWIACQKYDPDKGAKFRTFFSMLIGNRISHLLQNAFAQKRQSNLWTETLDSDAVRAAVEEITSTASAEDHYLAELAVTEHSQNRKNRRIT